MKPRSTDYVRQRANINERRRRSRCKTKSKQYTFYYRNKRRKYSGMIRRKQNNSLTNTGVRGPPVAPCGASASRSCGPCDAPGRSFCCCCCCCSTSRDASSTAKASSKVTSAANRPSALFSTSPHEVCILTQAPATDIAIQLRASLVTRKGCILVESSFFNYRQYNSVDAARVFVCAATARRNVTVDLARVNFP